MVLPTPCFFSLFYASPIRVVFDQSITVHPRFTAAYAAKPNEAIPRWYETACCVCFVAVALFVRWLIVSNIYATCAEMLDWCFCGVLCRTNAFSRNTARTCDGCDRSKDHFEVVEDRWTFEKLQMWIVPCESAIRRKKKYIAHGAAGNPVCVKRTRKAYRNRRERERRRRWIEDVLHNKRFRITLSDAIPKWHETAGDALNVLFVSWIDATFD